MKLKFGEACIPRVIIWVYYRPLSKALNQSLVKPQEWREQKQGKKQGNQVSGEGQRKIWREPKR